MERNVSQRRAIAHLSGPMMVLAGPGSGKTSVIVERTAYLLEQGKVPPSSVLVVTFSKAAAREMRERFLKYMGQRRTEVTFGTFHGVFYGILKQAYGLGAANILSGAERSEILREMTLAYGRELGEDGDFQEDISREISVVKGSRIPLEHFYSACCPDEVFRQIFLGYREACRERRKLDFDDMLLYCYELLEQREDIRRAWQDRFQYVLVDEFQDINQLQYEIVRILAKPQDNLFVVGDDDQSIYHFRGARPEIMRNFLKDYPGAERTLLDVNYRCSGNVLRMAMRVIANNENRFGKKISTPNPKGMPVKCRVFEDPREEAFSVARELAQRAENGEDLRETAVLLRTNQEAESVAAALMEAGVPFAVREQLPNLYGHWICRNMLAYLHLAAGDRRRGTFLEIMNRPNRYLSRDALREPEFSFEKLLGYYQGKDWMCDRITTLLTHLRILAKLPPYGAINFIRHGMGYEEYLQEYAGYRKIKKEELIDVLDRLMESAKGLQTLEQWEKHMEDYTRELKEQTKKGEAKREGVLISTLHGVKGLEFDHVYILNVNEGSIPYRRAVMDEALEEERRLFYVGMTRARKELALCYVRKQYEKEREPSRFLEEAGVWRQ